jgi:hypothetical protein
MDERVKKALAFAVMIFATGMIWYHHYSESGEEKQEDKEPTTITNPQDPTPTPAPVKQPDPGIGIDPYHAGERALQQKVGVRDRMREEGSRVIRTYMTTQHQAFYSLLPYIVLCSIDPSGQPWVKVVAGPEGFAKALSPTALRITNPSKVGFI